MRITVRRILVATASLLGLSACAAPPAPSSSRTPVRWIMVEKPFGDVVPGGQTGDGRVDPQSMTLTLQPLYPEDLNWEIRVDPHDFFVEILNICPPILATPGETVSATVRVGRAREGDLYRLIARASSSDVQIVGDREHTVCGDMTADFRFTSLAPGRGGIAIGVERVELRGR